MRAFLIPVLFSIMILGLIGHFQEAEAATFTITNDATGGDCTNPPVSGIWDSGSSTCFAGAFLLPSGNILQIDSGTTLALSQLSLIQGTLNIDWTVTLRDLAGINNDGQIDNDGIINNDGLIQAETVSSEIDNTSGIVNNDCNGIINVIVTGNPVVNICQPGVGGTALPIDTTSLLLAGASVNVWMIPVVLSAAGFGLLIARKL